MKSITITLFDETTVFYYGFRNAFAKNIDSWFFLNKEKLVRNDWKQTTISDFVFYCIHNESGAAEVALCCKRLRQIQPQIKIIACFGALNQKTLKATAYFPFSGFIMLEDNPKEILNILNKIDCGQAGISPEFLKKYLLFKFSQKKAPDVKTRNTMHKKKIP